MLDEVEWRRLADSGELMVPHDRHVGRVYRVLCL